jgi:tetratricopeptide (TPR) repeat protein
MIVRNEERMLPDCLASVRGVADEVVVVDTGSTDATRDIAVRLGARVYERPWEEDFSAPRNEALRHATGDWVLQLDADERLGPGAGRALRKAMRRRDMDLGMLRLHDARRLDAAPEEVLSGRQRIGAPVMVPRLMRRTPDLAYRGVVHESVEDWLVRRGLRVAVLDVDVVHLGAVPELRRALGKRQRNLALLERRCREEPDSITPLGFLAIEYLEEGRVADARAVAEQGWRMLEGQPRHRPAQLLGVTLALCQARAGEHAAMRETAERLLEREGLRSDYAYLRGLARELGSRACAGRDRREALEAAGRAYRDAIEAGRAEQERVCIGGSGSWAARTRLGTVLLLLGRPDEALAEFRAALAEVPDEPEARLGEAEAVLDAGDAAAALARVERLLGERPDGWVLAAAAARASGAPGEARLLLARAGERVAAGYVAVHRAERHVAMVRELSPRPDEAAALLAALMQRRPVPPELVGVELDAAFLRNVARQLLPEGRGRLLEPLLEPAAGAVSPGLPGRMREVLASLGAALPGRGA